ncbi:tetratricopeptide repeat domain-containing protein [Rhexocercosporidium sp. MPI-PUGE-AT-0058]|nr:tetratricopeptide repeat domain-containing protein [Rhexocercosporidium sp. MPI-PUGE-AT-0058]
MALSLLTSKYKSLIIERLALTLSIGAFRSLPLLHLLTMASPSVGRLREISQSCQTNDADVDIILIPGIGITSIETWPFCSQEWLKRVLPSGSKIARVLAFEFSTSLDDKFSWEEVLIGGYQLLQELAKARSSPGHTRETTRPIFCVCHSLGGLVLKQALCVANEQLQRYDEYRDLVNAVSGIVFLSTPHMAASSDDTFNTFMTILKMTSRKTIKVPSLRTEKEAQLLSGLAKRFEGIYFRTPVLSIYEKKETRISERRFKSRTEILVSKSTCTTHAPFEKFLGLSLDHKDTCNFFKAPELETSLLNAFVTETLQGAESIISTRLKDLEFVYATVSSYSPTQSEIAGADHAEPMDLTGNATDGSTQMDCEIVPKVSSQETSRPKVRLPCIMLDTQVSEPSFCGREEILEHIGKELLPPTTKVTSSLDTGLRQFALCGMGGLGKTEIAREFALRHKDDFDVVLWVRADEIAKLNNCYQQISMELGLEEPSECKSHVVSRELVKGWLANPLKNPENVDDDSHTNIHTSSEATWLIIFDNADKPDILGDYWPQGNGSVLTTSRDPLAKRLFSMRTSGINLEPLSDEDGALLLMRLTGAGEEPEDNAEELANRISHKLGGVPMAISQMAGYIGRQELSLWEFMDLYNDEAEHADLYDKRDDSMMRAYPHRISTVWAFDKLRPEARRLLEILAFLDPDVVQEDLVVEASTAVFPKDVAFKNSHYRDLRTELLQSSLIRRNKQKNELSVHRLVQDVIKAQLSEDMIQPTVDLVVHLLWANWPSAMPKPSQVPELPQPKANNKRLEVGRWPVCAALYPHVLRLHQLWGSFADISTTTKLQFASLLNDAAWYQSERGLTRGFDGFFDTAMDICENAEHPDKDSLLSNIHFCLGAIAADTNIHEISRQHKEKSFDIQYRISQSLGTVDERLALAYSERSISRIQDGRVEEGIADLKREKEIRLSLGVYVPLSREANLGLAYMLQGELALCETLLVESLGTREKIFGKNDKESFRTGRILYALGNLRFLQGKFDESYACHQQAWEQFRSTIGDRNHRTADVAHRIAEHLIRLQRHEDAVNVINDALKTWSFDPESYKPELARTTFLKARLLAKLGKTQKAAVTLKVACRLRKEVTGKVEDSSSLTSEDFDRLVAFWSR